MIVFTHSHFRIVDAPMVTSHDRNISHVHNHHWLSDQNFGPNLSEFVHLCTSGPWHLLAHFFKFNTHVPNHFVPLKNPKYKGNGDSTKHHNNYKNHISLKRALSTLKCRAFYLKLTRVAEIWYGRIPSRSIRSWSDLKKAFLNQYFSSKEVDALIQRL